MPRAFNRTTAYHWYLGQAFWRERREHILKRANGKCEKCGQRPPTEVHHITYIRVFQELPSDLLAVCRQCHAEIHWRQPANDNQIQFRFFEEDTEPGERSERRFMSETRALGQGTTRSGGRESADDE